MRNVMTFVLWLMLAPVASAWNQAGHMTVAKLAWDGMSAGQRQAMTALLKEHPHYEAYFKLMVRPPNVSEEEYHFTLASTWADWLRGFAKSKDAAGKTIYSYHVGPRHYINWPFVRPSDAEMFKDKKLEYDEKENIIVGLNRALADLKSQTNTAADRAVALCWVLHLGGDIHQPLHNIGLFTKYTPTNDQGGNLFWVKEDDVPTRLHGFWDDLLGKQDSAPRAYEQAVDNVARLTRPDYAREKFAAERARKNVEDWSKDAMTIAIEVGYRKGTLRGYLLQRTNESQTEKAKAPPLPKEYREEALAVANRQAALAGYRSFDLLEDAFPRKK